MASKRVLIVEDQRDLARVFSAGLMSLGHALQVWDVPSGEEALLVVDRYTLDLLIIDIKLPGISGFELMRKIKAQQSDLKVIVITGLTDPQVRERITQLNADAYFFKPIELSDLLSAAEEALGLPSLPGSPITQEEPAPTLNERLSTLRQETGAQIAMILDDRGQILVQAGILPDKDAETGLLSALMGLFSAGEKVSHILGMRPPQDLHALIGPDYTFYLAHLGYTYALVLATPAAEETSNISQVATILQPAIQDLCAILSRHGIPLEVHPELPTTGPLPELEEEAAPEEVEPAELENLLERLTSPELDEQEVDTFWDARDEKINTGSLHPETLTYDQARKLGLTPDE